MKKCTMFLFMSAFIFIGFMQRAHAGQNWQNLSKDQKGALRRGDILVTETPDPQYAFGQWMFLALVKPFQSPRNPVSPATACAAIFWDQASLPKYQTNILSVDYVPLFPESRSNPTLSTITLRGLGPNLDMRYQELLGIKSYGRTYVASWLSLSPPIPGIIEKMDGSLTMEEVQRSGDVLLVYLVKVKPSAMIANQGRWKRNGINNGKEFVSRLRSQMVSGATDAQLNSLQEAIGTEPVYHMMNPEDGADPR